jgi:hypothetical protein
VSTAGEIVVCEPPTAGKTLRLRTRAAQAYIGLAFLCVGGCALLDGAAPDTRTRLGQTDEITLPKTGRKLDDYTCGNAVLVCEDRITKLRCRCSTGTEPGL